MPQTIIELLNKGTQANLADTFRRGNLIELPGTGSLVITGDLHGHRRNFERIVTFADLASNPGRHVILQEIIHGGPEDLHGGCMSYKLLFDAVCYQLKFPGQVHFIMANHDTAFIIDSEVMKDGKEMNRSMCTALEREYKEAGADIIQAMKQYLFRSLWQSGAKTEYGFHTRFRLTASRISLTRAFWKGLCKSRTLPGPARRIC